MEQAHALAALGEGSTSPNPRVGCVLVRDGRAVGTGFHMASGKPHAEITALDEAGDGARGSTLYVNLEPCPHYGRTPPCTDRIIAAGIRRVVASITDPNPAVNGRGFRLLREAGLKVETGLLAAEARALNHSFLHWHATGRPWVTLKAGVSLDGMISAREGRSRWITGPLARRFAHRLRLRHDAVLVGAGTVRRDDPRLTARIGDEETVPLRVVLTSRLDLDPEARVLDARGGTPATRVYAPEDVRAPGGRLGERAEIRRLPARGGRLELDSVLSDLGTDGVQSVLVEGGGRTVSWFLEDGAAHGAAVFSAPILLGARGGTPWVDGPSAERPDAGWRLTGIRRVPLAGDLLVLGDLTRPAAGGG
jgi:diaminohydroxyphosphoribosylaminopyrimidine deaminase/5-amino-6-(5-phosphoribosylamino)uracil reductase